MCCAFHPWISKHFTNVGKHYYPYFPNKETEAQRGVMSWLRWHRKSVTEWGTESRFPDSQASGPGCSSRLGLDQSRKTNKAVGWARESARLEESYLDNEALHECRLNLLHKQKQIFQTDGKPLMRSSALASEAAPVWNVTRNNTLCFLIAG